MGSANDQYPPGIPDMKELWSRWPVSWNSDGTGITALLQGVQVSELKRRSEKSRTVPRDGYAHDELFKLKLAILKDVVLFYNHGDDKIYTTLMKDLHSPAVEKFAIDHRIKRAREGKEVANKKYKDGHKLEAMFTYAVAWSLLLPYHPDHFAKAEDGEPDYRDELGKLEAALFSNISAMAKLLFTDPDLDQKQKDIAGHIGIGASEVCIFLKEFVTVGIMAKSSESSTSSRRRAKEIALGLQPGSTLVVPSDKVRFFKEQEEKIRGVAEKAMFNRIPASGVARPYKL